MLLPDVEEDEKDVGIGAEGAWAAEVSSKRG
jgi:hypothetical protein